MKTSERPGGSDLLNLPQGSHACWVVADPQAFEPIAAALIAEGRAMQEKVFAFGPAGASQEKLRETGATIADPREAFLAEGPLDPRAMFTMFREQVAQARREGFLGLRVVADMDWLIPARPSTDDIVSFEASLDRVIHELGATVVCAYRKQSFDDEAIGGVAAVHPVASGTERSFELIATGPRSWRLSGEVDNYVVDVFASAFAAATSNGDVIVDVGDLRFIDCAGMRAIARALSRTSAKVRFRSVGSTLRRFWALTGLAQVAPLSEIVSLESVADDGIPSDN